MASALVTLDNVSEEKTRRIEELTKETVDLERQDGRPFHLKSMSNYTTRINMKDKDEEFVKQYRAKVVDVGMAQMMNDNRVINWSRRLQHNLEPLLTQGDGNCLVHAVSQALWGVHDTYLFLRRLVFVSLLNDTGEYRQRWEREHRILNDYFPELLSMGYDEEWQLILNESKSQHNNTLPYDPLQGIHLFALANILRRPIIVVAEPYVKSSSGSKLQKNIIAGIYLPLLWKPDQCSTKTPVLLAFHGNHFSPLVIFETGTSDDESGRAPTVRSNQNRSSNFLPLFDSVSQYALRFATDTERADYEGCLRSYLGVHNIVYQHHSDAAKNKTVLSAELSSEDIPDDLNVVPDHIAALEREFQRATEITWKSAVTDVAMYKDKSVSLCRMEGCGEAAPDGEPYCEACLRGGPLGGAGGGDVEMATVGNKCHVCFKEGKPQQDGLCVRCYLEAVVRDPETLENTSHKSGEFDWEVVMEREATNDLNQESVSAECRTEGCQNRVEPTKCVYCDKCLTEKLTRREEAVAQKTSLSFDVLSTRPAEDVVIPPSEPMANFQQYLTEASQPSSGDLAPRGSSFTRPVKNTALSKQYKCVNPFCKNAVLAQHQHCAECLHALADHDKAKTRKKELSINCSTPACTFFGSPKFGGLCSKCFKTSMSQGACEKPGVAKPKDPAAARKTFPQRRGNQCLEKGCPRYGDANMDGYCTTCFNERANPTWHAPPRRYDQRVVTRVPQPMPKARRDYRAAPGHQPSGGYYVIPAQPLPRTEPNVCRICTLMFNTTLTNKICDECYANYYGEDVVD